MQDPLSVHQAFFLLDINFVTMCLLITSVYVCIHFGERERERERVKFR